jgi:hypothetical protein
MQANTVRPSVLLGRLQEINRMKLPVADQNGFGYRGHQVSQFLKEGLLLLS